MTTAQVGAMATIPATADLGVTDDVVIVGGGLAGLFCALQMAPRPVTMIASGPFGERAASAFAERDMAAPFASEAMAEEHAAATVAAGAGIAEARIADAMCREAPSALRALEAHGVPLDGTDPNGNGIVPLLANAVRRTPSIRVLEDYSVEDLVKDGGRVSGLIALSKRQDMAAPEIRLRARAVVIATGGVGALFAVTTKSPFACGEGLAIAARAGALVADAEFVRFQPGEAGEPAAHFHIGGVLTDATGRTSVDGLWACGEVASTGVHGADLMTPNALLEALVFASRVARDVAAIYPSAERMSAPEVVSESEGPGLFGESAAVERLRRIMSDHVGAVRSHEGLVTALDGIGLLERQGGPSHGFRNMITTARLIATAALMRTESRGAHVRSDFPEADPAQARRAIVTLRTVEAEARAAVQSTERRYA